MVKLIFLMLNMPLISFKIMYKISTKDQVQLDPSELKKILCAALHDIGDKCTVAITKCFSQDDVEQMRFNHVAQMEKVCNKLSSMSSKLFLSIIFLSL